MRGNTGRSWIAATVVLGTVLAGGCSSGGGGEPDGRPAGAPVATSASASAQVSADAVTPSPTDTVRRTCPERTLAGMGLAQRVGQLFVAGVTSTGATRAELRAVRRHHLGGVILMGHNEAGTEATRRVAARVQAAARADGVRLWVAADQEGGYVQVLHGPGFAEMPTALAQGSLAPRVLRSRAHRWGRQLRAAGVNLNLAPVADTVPARLGTANKPIGFYYREYGHTPRAVRRHAMAFLRGMRSAGVQTTVKHFPGLGRVRRNTDTSAGVTDRTTTRHDAYVRPFRAAAEARVPVVLVSSARYTRIDRKHLAPFSSTVLRGMLRHDLGFTGVVMSDDLGAAEAVSAIPAGRRAVRFLRAGGTVVLTVVSSTVPPMTRAVLRRARQRPGFHRLVNAAALRVLRVKNRADLLPCSPGR